MKTGLVILAEAEIVNELPMEPIFFGLTALGILVFLLLLLLTFKGMSFQHN